MQEILRSPVEVDSLSHYVQAFIHVRWGLEMTRAGSSEAFLVFKGYKNSFPKSFQPFSDQGLWPHPPKLYHP